MVDGLFEGGDKEVLDALVTDSQMEKFKEEAELSKASSFYNSIFTHRLIQVINQLASVATFNAYASHILFNIAHPDRIGTLISLLINGSPKIKMVTIKTLEHLILVLPPELFEESVKIIL